MKRTDRKQDWADENAETPELNAEWEKWGWVKQGWLSGAENWILDDRNTGEFINSVICKDFLTMSMFLVIFVTIDCIISCIYFYHSFMMCAADLLARSPLGKRSLDLNRFYLVKWWWKLTFNSNKNNKCDYPQHKSTITKWPFHFRRTTSLIIQVFPNFPDCGPQQNSSLDLQPTSCYLKNTNFFNVTTLTNPVHLSQDNGSHFMAFHVFKHVFCVFHNSKLYRMDRPKARSL